MLNFLIVCHGEMAGGIYDAIRLISGEHEGIGIISLKENDSIDELESKITSAINDLLTTSDAVFIAVDLIGASPFNMASKSANSFSNVEVVSGVNLPMMLEIIMQREALSLSEAVELATESGRQGIKSLREIFRKGIHGQEK